MRDRNCRVWSSQLQQKVCQWMRYSVAGVSRPVHAQFLDGWSIPSPSRQLPVTLSKYSVNAPADMTPLCDPEDVSVICVSKYSALVADSSQRGGSAMTIPMSQSMSGNTIVLPLVVNDFPLRYKYNFSCKKNSLKISPRIL